MCYASGALGRFNLVERLVGEKNYRRLDPVMAYSEKRTDKQLTKAFGEPEPIKAPDIPGLEPDAGLAPRRAIRNDQSTLLTGPSIAQPSTSRLSLLG